MGCHKSMSKHLSPFKPVTFPPGSSLAHPALPPITIKSDPDQAIIQKSDSNWLLREVRESSSGTKAPY